MGVRRDAADLAVGATAPADEARDPGVELRRADPRREDLDPVVAQARLGGQGRRPRQGARQCRHHLLRGDVSLQVGSAEPREPQLEGMGGDRERHPLIVELELAVFDEEPADARNWLPVPAGPFVLMVRLYLPGSAILDGSYQLPPIEPMP